MLKQKQYLQSVNLKSGTDFPYLVLDVVDDRAYPRNPGFQVMHWHRDLQFLYLLAGNVEVRTLDRTLPVRAGEAVFINQEVVHNIRRLGNCHYNSFIFPASFLTFYPGSPAKAFVDDVTASGQLSLLHFSPDIGWQQEAIRQLQHLSQLEQEKTALYPYEVLTTLCTLWLTVRRHITPSQSGKKESALSQRVQKILQFIEQHYAEELTLFDLANSAHISKSECARCFRQGLGCTPFQYLMEYRMSRAAQLLQETDRPVGEVALAAGFHQMSYFGRCFREKTGLSPREYRRANRTSDKEER